MQLTTNKIRVSIIEGSSNWMSQLVKSVQEVDDMKLIETFSCAEDALNKIIRNQPHIVVISIDLPEMNGISCMMRILKKAPHISFLMFTKYEHSKYVFASFKAGATGYILKKDGIELAINGIRELNAGGAPMSRNIAQKVLRSFRPTDQLIQKTSTREREILNLLSKGFLYKEIAIRLNPQISEGTVKQHIHNIYKKLGVSNKVEAINKYLGKK